MRLAKEGGVQPTMSVEGELAFRKRLVAIRVGNRGWAWSMIMVPWIDIELILCSRNGANFGLPRGERVLDPMSLPGPTPEAQKVVENCRIG